MGPIKYEVRFAVSAIEVPDVIAELSAAPADGEEVTAAAAAEADAEAEMAEESSLTR